MGLFTKKSIAELHAEAGGELLRRSLGPLNLTALGIGSIIGTGIFVLTGTAAAQNAGPALVLSMIISAIGCAFSGSCYAEFASMVPVAGSAYTYAYATIGELVAWIIGWDLILEYALSDRDRRRRLVGIFRQPARRRSASSFRPLMDRGAVGPWRRSSICRSCSSCRGTARDQRNEAVGGYEHGTRHHQDARARRVRRRWRPLRHARAL